MIKVVVAGCQGRMGSALIQGLLSHPQLKLIGATVSPHSHAAGKDMGTLAGLSALGLTASHSLDPLMSDMDVLIDFTSPIATLQHVESCLAHQKKIVIGTTGLDQNAHHLLKKASQTLSIVLAPNMSIGVAVMMNLLKQATQAIGKEADIEIIETHHRHKKDAPSGTALSMARTIAEQCGSDLDEVAMYDRRQKGTRQQGEIGISTLRIGDIIGEHKVMFGLPGETLEITHRANHREIYAQGALRAATWLADKPPGLYTMQDVLFLDGP